jgi:hypothetical protein
MHLQQLIDNLFVTVASSPMQSCPAVLWIDKERPYATSNERLHKLRISRLAGIQKLLLLLILKGWVALA